jgi:hypothetical protein
MPRCPDLAIFVLTNGQTDGRIELITLPLAHARGVISYCVVHYWYSLHHCTALSHDLRAAK